MSYLAQAKLNEDSYIIDRLKACAAQERIPSVHEWVMANLWELTAQPGWAEAYAQALAGEKITDPAAWAGAIGADPDIITDAMILAAVKAVNEPETPSV
ncbi:hypothetical protein ICM05_01015 [Leucobacter sp. cx-42]|uniref:hypothetical protein n=1 Tax=unclassified Leucobacter TaxID=2621730 RepID=UPI00165EB1B3|nr:MULTISPECIES: hypothetical protein [unclassified Leucobacter]MBC9953228.1 hypothetical protein [Leucobacter sp. cx-42]